MHGLLLINKPPNWTSFDVVRYIRKISGIHKVGHAGSLDPIAQGLLILCLGEYTQLVSSLMSKEKEYIVTIRLGETRDTDDVSGKLISKHKVPTLSKNAIKEALQEFTGEILQVPPMFSALKLKGKPLYKLARQGKVVPRRPRKVHISKIELLFCPKLVRPSPCVSPNKDGGPAILTLKITCGKGTYIRALARDLGTRLGCGACVHSLLRTRIGEFILSQATQPKSIKTIGQLQNLLIKNVGVIHVGANPSRHGAGGKDGIFAPIMFGNITR